MIFLFNKYLAVVFLCLSIFVFTGSKSLNELNMLTSKPDLKSDSASLKSDGYNDIILFKDNIYAVGTGERIDRILKNGEKVTVHNSEKTNLNCAIATSEMMIAAGDNGTILYSKDGSKFYYSIARTNKNINAISFKDGIYIACADEGIILSSKTGKSWSVFQIGTKGNIISLSSNSHFFIGVTDGGEIVKSEDGLTWEIKDYNKEYAGYNRFSKFNKILAINNSIIIIGTYEDGSPSILLSSLGNVWTEREPFYYDEEGTVKFLSSKPNDVTFDMNSDQFIVACDNGELLSLPSCSRCNKYLKINNTNLKAIINVNEELVMAGNNFTIYTYKL